ncbi:MAG: hypothetical protein FJ272_05745 [Planctomycetes bacterium]|nr:hypothetical protein [Planctomycetota bacterium]
MTSMEVALSWPYCLARGSERDLDLVARCRDGCAEAFGVLLNRYRERVINEGEMALVREMAGSQQ